ncbi:alpha/beta hydrolase [Rhizobium sp. P38BS-XIX]|uniref:alpha/beta family hydrolase n=1 Tax=Rhizobium sp. P38BS-XIX TaxID=2726740 RepID=UPI0014569EC5|nr:alpha/beta family hydrolase [Rhizobium sp. P38BS-XIX]NLR99846.1 alpha/beta hydrolase [Rhizobium sp. P38BS-XIX]
MPHDILVTGPDDAKTTIILAHGAGGAMDTSWMDSVAVALSENELRVIRFEFDYMSARRTSGKRAPPPRADLLCQEYKDVVGELDLEGTVVIAGKSMGERVASMIADGLYDAGAISGLLCLGYPFHPIGKPDNLRTGHLQQMKTPTLICQGTRDLFGSKDEVLTYTLSGVINLFWLEDGDHDFRPRKAVSGLTAKQNIAAAVRHVTDWSHSLPASARAARRPQ